MLKFRDNHTWSGFFRRTVAAQIHLLGFAAAVVGFGVFIASPSIQGSHFAACAIFALSGAFVMAVSSFYHFVHDGFSISLRLEKRLEDLDHISIYLFIAGTYTPFLLNTMTSSWKAPLLGMIWSIAAMGILYTLLKHRLPPWMQSRATYTGVFLLMGWALLIRSGEIFENLSPTELTRFLGGAGSYTLGAFIYALKWPNPRPGLFGFHELWHVAVVIGFAFHYALILGFYGSQS